MSKNIDNRPEYLRLGITPVKKGEIASAPIFEVPAQKRGANFVPAPPAVGHGDQLWYPEAREEAKVSNEKISFDEVELPSTSRFAESEETIKVDNKYFLFVNGEMVKGVANLWQMEELVEYVLFGDDSPYPNISVDNLMVFSKLDLKVGVSIRSSG